MKTSMKMQVVMRWSIWKTMKLSLRMISNLLISCSKALTVRKTRHLVTTSKCTSSLTVMIKIRTSTKPPAAKSL